MPEDTKRLLSNAYLALLSDGGRNAVTVTEIVERAGVSRMTFYYHFQDIYDLVDWTYRSYFNSLGFRDMDTEEAWHFLAGVLVQMVDTNGLCIIDNFERLDKYILTRMFSKMLKEVITEFFRKDNRLQKYSEEDAKFLIQLATFCTMGMLESRMTHEYDLDPDVYIEKFNRLIRDTVIAKWAL